ncbi:MAG: hypothetical protein A3F74_22430 [Betaproteobacteria bacterium RIFCSPLOWO2_12_FULL_62_58]|nr:MAG: hypothetical protein A3F74_22430 [Betaproteobacteria bacterium RIFCSPLOWO2_12_FULL_62_58]
MMSKTPIFSDDWLRSARAENADGSWSAAAIETLETTGQIYLSMLRLWFERFPLSLKQKQQLRTRLESLRDDEHLGGVNELAWWAFIVREGFTAVPLATTTAPRPDFELQSPAHCFVEVSTLNVSEKDKVLFETKQGVALDHAETIRRVIGKLTDEKQRQLKYAADHKKPGVLALFDYTAWSGFGTFFCRTLGDFLLGKQVGFRSFPQELSAIVYLERKVLDGRIALSRQRSAVYYNPLALHPLPPGVFPSLNQSWLQLASVDSTVTEPWVWL